VIKRLLLAYLLFFSSLLIIVHSEEISFYNPCEAMVICAFPQLILGRNLTSTEMQLVFAKARVDGIILESGKVTNRDELAGLVLELMGRTEIIIIFSSTPPQRAVLIGYLLELTNNAGNHFVLAGTNRQPLYNPCNVIGSVVSYQEVYVYSRQ
jgi:hypothetical protein